MATWSSGKPRRTFRSGSPPGPEPYPGPEGGPCLYAHADRLSRRPTAGTTPTLESHDENRSPTGRPASADQAPRLVPDGSPQQEPPPSCILGGFAATDPQSRRQPPDRDASARQRLRRDQPRRLHDRVEESVEAWQRQPDALAILIGSLNGHAAEGSRPGSATSSATIRSAGPLIVGGNLSVGANKGPGDEAARLLADASDAVLTDAYQIVPHPERPSRRPRARRSITRPD